MTANRRRIWMGASLLAAILAAFAFPAVRRSAVSMTRPDLIGPTIYSKSALGHATAFRMLEDIGIPAEESNLGSGAHFDANSVTVIAEPRTDDATLDDVRAMLDAPTVLLILPKREGTADPKRPNWIGTDALIAESDVQRVLRLTDKGATVVRNASAASWVVSSRFGNALPEIRHTQLIRSENLRPLLASEDGILIGESRAHGRRLVVLSDPDLMANHAIARGGNAQIFVSLIENLRAGHDGRVIFDEFIHGYSPRPFHMMGILFQFPFVLVTAQLALGVGLLLWAAMARFGMPRELPPAIGAGRRSLIEAGAGLLSRKGDPAALAARYYEEMARDAAVHLRAPAGMPLSDLLTWLAESGKAGAVPGEPQAANAQAAVRSAQQVYAWRRELSGGSSERT